jgi:hypothetical protein
MADFHYSQRIVNAVLQMHEEKHGHAHVQYSCASFFAGRHDGYGNHGRSAHRQSTDAMVPTLKKPRFQLPLWAFISVGIIVYIFDTVIAYRLLTLVVDQSDRLIALTAFRNCDAL